MRQPILATLLLLFAAAALAEGEAPDPRAFLAETRAKMRDYTARGLESLSADLTLRRTDDENVLRMKDDAAFGYAFAAPEKEEFLFDQTPAALRKGLSDAFANLWRDATGALWFSTLETATDLKMEEGPGGTVVITGGNTGPPAVPFSATFDAVSGEMREFDLPSIGVKIAYGFAPKSDGLAVAWREVWLKGARALRTTYRAAKTVSGLSLPTVVELASEKNTFEYAIAWTKVNGRPAEVEEPSAEEVAARVFAFEKSWRELTPTQKTGAMLDLSELACDAASAAIAKHALKDPDESVRLSAAEVLSVMKRGNVVPALISALKTNEKDIKPYLMTIHALGEIGDPRAVDALSKDWWNQKVGEYGIAAAKTKIRALGKIRHVSAVDALLDTFTMAKDETIGQLKGDIVESLVKLTGQNFLFDRDAWNAWWKKNRAGFRF